MEQQIIEILKNNKTQRIGFNYVGTKGFGFRLSPGDFTTVALNIQQGNIGVVQGGAPDGVARYSVSQDGGDKANTFYIGKNNDAPPVFESTMVHESVHAICDLKGITMPWLDAETIAYIAQGFYLFYAGKEDGLSQPAYYGLECARDYQAGGFDQFVIDALRELLLKMPLYSGYIRGTFNGDG